MNDSVLMTQIDSPLSLNDWMPMLRMPLIWAIVLGAISVLLLLPRSSVRQRSFAALFGVAALGCLLAAMPYLDSTVAHITFWTLGVLTVIAAVATISVRSPVYAAIWFAISLLGTAGLFLFQGAQFLGVATIVLYAGAIVVMFLFVIMLAQPEGHSSYDRISWSGFAKPMAVFAAALLVGITTFSFAKMPAFVTPAASAKSTANLQVMSNAHMAKLGNELFGKHLLSVELAGTLLLVALVGAIAMVMQAKIPSAGERIVRE